MVQHWQHGKSPSDANWHMLQNRMLCDVTFKVGQRQKQEPAHKFVLTTRSPVFEAMFCGPLAESSHEICIPDIEPDIFECLLRFMYTGEIIICEENVVPLLYAASKYEVMDLVQMCSEFLENYINPETVCAILQEGVTFGATQLIDRCLTDIYKEPAKVCDSDDFTSLDRVALKMIFQSDCLCMDEDKVWKYCVKWAEERCKRNGMEASHENLRSVLGEVLHLIRFPCMDEEKLGELENPPKLLTEEELAALVEDKKNGTRTLAGVFNYRNRLHKDPVLLARFDGEFDNNYSYEDNQIDAISFSCSEDTYIKGLSIFTPSDPGLLKGSLVLLEGSNVIYTDDQRLVTSLSSDKYDHFCFDKPVPLKQDTIYTIKLQLQYRQKGYCGRNGKQIVNSGYLTVTFLDSKIEGSTTTVTDGQIHGLLLHL